MRVRRMKAIGCGAVLALLVFAAGGNAAADAPADRQAPDVLQPTESAAAVVRLRLCALVFSSDADYLMFLKGPPNENMDYDVQWVKVKEIKAVQGEKPARQPVPARAAELVAAFPLKAQIQEFQDKIHLKSAADVLSAKSAEVVDGSPLPAFRFLGVRVQRREVDAGGEAVGKWKPVEAEDDYAPLVFLAGGAASLPRDDPRLAPILFPGLAMPRLPTFGELLSPPVDEYPRLEDELKSLKAILGAPTKAAPVPDACLIRVFDLTIEPGKTYEYRIQVRMASLDSGRKDAGRKELTAKDWYVLPQRVAVPTDMHVYAVDQAKLDANKGPKLPTQTVLQIHKWVDFLPLRKRNEVAVGDWVIAERVATTRGEPIGRQRAEVPYWRKWQDRFAMATDQPPPEFPDQPQVNSVEVAFEPDGKETILVDFTGGDGAPVEVLLCTADGKLLARNSAVDAADPDRFHRVEAVRAWIRTVKTSSGDKKTDPANPFDK